jgi:hypothetical protein
MYDIKNGVRKIYSSFSSQRQSSEGESRGEKLSGRGISVHDGELFYRNYSRMEKLAHRL